jgi:hypothetical protein
MFNRNKIKKIINIPYQSQNDNTVSDEWKDRACAIACVKMVLDIFSDDKKTMPELIEEGLIINAHTDQGWSHQGIVRILRNHGVLAYSQEFKSIKIIKKDGGVLKEKSEYSKKMIEDGLLKILLKINSGEPVICSVKPGFDENKFSHTILLVGFNFDKDKKVLIYHDSDSRSGEIKENKEVKLDIFMEYWKELAIFLN